MSASDHLSPEQFAATYASGMHQIPTDHVWGIRDTEAVDDPSRNLDSKIQADGIKEPLDVAVLGGHASLADGHHRLLAAKRLGLTHVPVSVDHIS